MNGVGPPKEIVAVMPDKKEKIRIVVPSGVSVVVLATTFLTCPAYAAQLPSPELPSVEVHFEALEKLRRGEVVSVPESESADALVQLPEKLSREVKTVPVTVQSEPLVQEPRSVVISEPKIAAPVEAQTQSQVVIAEPKPKARPGVAAASPVAKPKVEAEDAEPLFIVKPKPVEEKLQNIVELVELKEEPETTDVAQLEDGEEVRLPMIVKEEASEEEVQESKDIIVQKHNEKRTLFSVFKKLPFLSDSPKESVDEALALTDEKSAVAVEEIASLPVPERGASEVEEASQDEDKLIYIKPSEERQSDRKSEEITIVPVDENEVLPWKAEDRESAEQSGAEVASQQNTPEEAESEEQKRWFSAMQSFFRSEKKEEVSQVVQAEAVDVDKKVESIAQEEVIDIRSEKPAQQAKAEVPDNVQIILPNEVHDDEDGFVPRPELKPLGIAEKSSGSQPGSQRSAEIKVQEAESVAELAEKAAPVPLIKEEVAEVEELKEITEDVPVEAEKEADQVVAEGKSLTQEEEPQETAQAEATEEKVVEERDVVAIMPGVVNSEFIVVGQDYDSRSDAVRVPDQQKVVAQTHPEKVISEKKESTWKSWLSFADKEKKVVAEEAVQAELTTKENAAVPVKEATRDLQNVIGGPMRQEEQAEAASLPDSQAVSNQYVEESVVQAGDADSSTPLRIIPEKVAVEPELVDEPSEEVVEVSSLPLPQEEAVVPQAEQPSTSVDSASAQEEESKKIMQGKLDPGVLLSIDFDADQTGISDFDKDRLAELVQRIMSDGKQRVKVVSYAKGTEKQASSARRISLQRAIAIRSHMIKSGLESIRINVQAVGDKAEDEKNLNSSYIYLLDDKSS